MIGPQTGDYPRRDTGPSPVGVLGSDELAAWISDAFATQGRRVIRLLPPAERLAKTAPSSVRIDFAATAADLASECMVIFSAVSNEATLREMLLGSPDRPGVGAEALPGAVLIDCAVKTPRELQAMAGLLGTRGVAVVDLSITRTRESAALLLSGFPDAVLSVQRDVERLGHLTLCGALGQAHLTAALDGVAAALRVCVEQDIAGLAAALTGAAPPLRVGTCAETARCWAVVQRLADQRGDDISQWPVFSALRPVSNVDAQPLSIAVSRFMR